MIANKSKGACHTQCEAPLLFSFLGFLNELLLKEESALKIWTRDYAR